MQGELAYEMSHYTSACRGGKKNASVNLLEVNVLEMEYQTFFCFIQDDHSIQATWRKFGSFLICSLMFGEIFN
jgi:ethanolamine utilization cobalamin adenosyltransferase